MNNNNYKRVLVLKDFSLYFEKDILENYKDITFSTPLRKLNLFGRVIRKILKSFNILPSFFLDKYFKEIQSYNIIILFAGFSNRDLIATKINNKLNKNKKIKLIYWYWNPVNISTPPSNIRKYAQNFNLWSFDKNDCDKYKLNFNTTFYSKYVKCPINKIDYDIYFIGRNKKRYSKIIQLKNLFLEMDLTHYIYVIDETNKNKLPYILPKQNLENISRSLAILDILQDGQSGLTLRSMESIFLNKKLITTDQNIINYAFYSSKNVFILNAHDNSEIKKFLLEDYELIPEDIVHYYDIDSWVKRFI